MTTLGQSYEYCRRVARSRAKNFYYSFLLLPKPKRDAMCAMYAFMRYCDDLSDEPADAGQPRALEMERWRADLEQALAGSPAGHPVWPAFLDTVQRYRIPHQYFYDMIEGVSSDLEERRLQTFTELYRYCYQVASVVGLTIIHIFGFESRQALKLAEACGIAFQLTNILRDVREDSLNGRVYLPQEDLDRFGVTPAMLAGDGQDERFRQLMQFEADRARAYYDESVPLIGLVHRSSRSSLWALIEIYSRLLRRIEQSNFDVLRRRIRLSGWEKIGILLQAKLRAPRLAAEPARPTSY